MKEKLTSIVTVSVIMVAILAFAGLAGAGPLAQSSLQGGAPTVVSYQGRVTLGGSPYNGYGYFKFAIVNADGETYWSHDGTSDGGSEPDSSVPLDVGQGLFNVLLGDPTYENMTEVMEAGVFEAETETYLRAWFSDSEEPESFQLLSPDRRVAAVPYSLQAQEAANADTVDGYEGAVLEESSEIDADIAAHAGIGDAHHPRYTDGEAQSAVLLMDSRATAPADNLVMTTRPPHGGEDGGWRTSATIGTDGLGLISYIGDDDGGGVALKAAHCDDTTCSSVTIFTLVEAAPGSEDGLNTSVAIGADGKGLISYVGPDGDLHIAHCGDTPCSDIRVDIYDLNQSCRATSLTIGADGLGLISYVNGSALFVAHCLDTACSNADAYQLDIGVGDASTSIATGIDGLGLISYYDNVNDDLKVAHCNDTACSSVTVVSLGGAEMNLGLYSSVTIGADGLGLISYYQMVSPGYSRLNVAHCIDVECSSMGGETLDTDVGVDVGKYNSITVGANGLPLVSYYDATNQPLKVAHCRDAICSSGSYANHTLDAAGDVGHYTSVTIGADGLPLISYYDATNLDLKIVHCSNALCAPYFRRR